MGSIWRDGAIPEGTTRTASGEFDVAVVGAGLTGLSTAVLLAEAGCRVVVLEAREVGAGTTGGSTAKVSLLQGTRLSAVAARHGHELVAQYVAGNRHGQEWLLEACAAGGVGVQRPAAVTYAADAEDLPAAEQELAVAQRAGLGVTWREHDGVPFPYAGGVALAHQAQVDPVALLGALTRRAVASGVQVVTGARAHDVHGDGDTVRTGAGDVRAARVVLATGIPVSDRGGFFARLSPERSYALAARLPGGDLPTDMYLSTGAPTRSIRTAPRDGELALLVGGNNHAVGSVRSERSAAADLADWTRRTFPGAEVTHEWSAQDYTPVDELPYVGPLTPTGTRVLVATGYAKWGMANAAAAAHLLTAQITGATAPAWADAYRSWDLHELAGAAQAARLNAGVAADLVRDRARAMTSSVPSAPPEGEGAVGREGGHAVAVSTVGGTTCRVSASCTHLGGIVHWNDAELTWDCPLHGSRFAADGTLLEGPATKDLRPR